MKADDLALRDALLSRQQQDLEDQFLTVTAKALTADVKARFGLRGPKPLKGNKAKPFAALYVKAMSISYLYGQLHVKKLMAGSEPIKLAGEQYQVPFAEAEAFLRSQVAINKTEYQALEAGLKFRAFTIARVGQEDVIRRIQGLYQKQLQSGASRAELLQRLDGILDQAGITVNNSSWLSTHYRNNMMAAYNAGRWAQVESNPYAEFLMYNAIVDGHTTKLCKKLHGVVKPKKDPFWKKYHATNHHNCRATMIPMTREQLKSRGITPSALKSKTIYESETMQKEHQFRAHPADILDAVPLNLAIKATQYKLWPEIMRFSALSMSGYLSGVLKGMPKQTLGPKIIKHALDGHPELKQIEGIVELAQKALNDFDEVWLMGTKDTNLGVKASIAALKWLDPDKKRAIAVFLRLNKQPKTFYILTKEKLDQRKALFGAQKIYPK